MDNASWRRRCSARRKITRSLKDARLILLLAGLLMSGIAMAIPPEFSARYRLTLGGLNVGEAELAFQRPAPDRYRYSLQSRSVGLPGLLYRVRIDELSEGRITATGFRPDRYHYLREGRGQRSARLAFDWENMHVVNIMDDHRWRMAIPGDTLDRLVSQLQLMQDLRHHRDELTYHVADGGLLRTYQLRLEGRETIRTGLGEFETLRIARQHDDARATTFWAAPSLHYLPVRIDHRERDNAFRMTLDAVDGLPASD